MHGNVGNYRQVNSLSDFGLFTFFFVVPGVLLALLAGCGIFGNPFAHRFAFDHRAGPTAA